MLSKKVFPFIVCLFPLISSCSEIESRTKFESHQWWITDKSIFVFKSRQAAPNNKTFSKFSFSNYNFLNGGYSFSTPLLSHFPIFKNQYNAKVYYKNGGPETSFTLEFRLSAKSKRKENFIVLKYIGVYRTDEEAEVDEEELEKINSLFSNDTKLIPYKLENLFLINTYNICLSNEDINLFSGTNQFSFLTGFIKDNEGNNKEVIFKSISSTEFKVYGFVDKKEVGDLLLEGEMSPIKDKDQSCSIDINVTKDYYFNNKYSSLTLNLERTPSGIKEEYPENFDFFFPEDKE